MEQTEISTIADLRSRAEAIRGFLDPGGKQKRADEIDKLSNAPGFWDDREKAQTALAERAALKTDINNWEEVASGLKEAGALAELCAEEEDAELKGELSELLSSLSEKIAALEFKKMLGGEDDSKGAIVEINAGAGGTEAQDWADMLYRMYLRYCDKNGFAVEILNCQDGDEAGIKSATLLVSGDHPYGYLKGESGVHRLVRISPFDSNKRRHTSFASVFIAPEIDDSVEVVVDERDLRIDTFRAGGKGGQHVNKTDSAVRITHLPTGTVVSCQNERSQHQNRMSAMKVLKARLYKIETEKQREKLSDLSASKKDIGWGNQIRSYVMHPYRMVKDHRTEFEKSDVTAVLDGELGDFIKTYLTSGEARE
ncbi:MAG: peptide chain release factor 2 [Candidatus Dadabacteria bacterium]|nr:peptide chain release factor 2 [Candidatus Dadabacteria bacterium]